MPVAAYIHIPFCLSKCKYCSFTSYTQIEHKEKYLSALQNEIALNYQNEELKTLYIGGGTPSLLQLEEVEKIVSLFNFAHNVEVTFEMNPDDANIDYLKKIHNIGINRISLGAQTFNDNILKLIGRRHSSQEIKNAIEYTKQAGFTNINLDLIYGLPCQNENILQQDLKTILSLDIPHISTYGLKCDEGSFFFKHLPQNLPDNDTQADFYENINKILHSNGYFRYEISNFSKVGFESQHNLNYWNNHEYYGFGASAHGYINGKRYANTSNLTSYIENQNKKESIHPVTKEEHLEETIFLGFRKTEGINISEINHFYHINFNEKYSKILDKYVPKYIEKTDNGYKLTLQGILLSNIILSEFIE